MNKVAKNMTIAHEGDGTCSCGQFYDSRFWLSFGSMILSSTTAFTCIIKFVCCSNNVYKCSCLNRPYDNDPDSDNDPDPDPDTEFESFKMKRRQKKQNDPKSLNTAPLKE